MNYLFTVISNHNLSKTLGILPDKRTWDSLYCLEFQYQESDLVLCLKLSYLTYN